MRMATIPAVIYARQSDTRNGSESLESQVEICRRGAERLGLHVVHELVEPPSTSGYKDRGRSRPEWRRLLQLVKRGEVRAVVAHKTDRLSRGGGPGWAPLIDAFEKAGVDLDRCIATPDGWIGELELAVRAAMDREEIKKHAERTRIHQDRRRAAGKPSGGGYRGFGYTRAMEVVPGEADLIRDGARRLLAGESLYSIARRWNDAGAPTPTGRAWDTMNVSQTLKRPALWGQLVHKGDVVGTGTWEPILDEVTGRRLHRRLTGPDRDVPGAGWHPRALFLSGILVCGRCASTLRGQRAQGSRPASYWCHRRLGQPDRCGALRVVATPVDAHVTDRLLEVLDGDLLARAAVGHRNGVDTGALLGELHELDNTRSALADDLAERRIGHADWLAATRALQRQIDLISARLADADRGDRLALLAGDGPLAERWELLEVDQRRALVDAAVESITIAPVGKRGPGFNKDRIKIRWAV